MIKAAGRASLLVIVILSIGVALWFHPIITLTILVFLWLSFMLYNDPPEHWN